MPSEDEWRELVYFANENNLRAKSYWKYQEGDPEKTDSYGFSALPGGCKVSDNYTPSFEDLGEAGYWWNIDGYIMLIQYTISFSKTSSVVTHISVRCVK